VGAVRAVALITQGVNKMPPSVANSTIFLGDKDRQMHAIDATTGKLLWMKQTDGDVETQVTAEATDDNHLMVYFGSDDQRICAYAFHAAHCPGRRVSAKRHCQAPHAWGYFAMAIDPCALDFN